MLAVSAPFHCALMQPAQDRLADDLRKLSFQPMQLPVIKNIDASPTTDPADARQALIHQVTGAVRWVDSMRKLISLGAEAFIEVGPGKVLCGLMRQIDRAQRCMNVEDEASLQKTISSLQQPSTGASS
jgi:[acyl-carrier-protein] S-malonyltransferase